MRKKSMQEQAQNRVSHSIEIVGYPKRLHARKDAEISCRLTKTLIAYANNFFQTPPQDFISQLPPSFNAKKLCAPYSWISLSEYETVLKEFKSITGVYNPRNFFDIGVHSLLMGTLGAGIGALHTLVSTRKIYALTENFSSLLSKIDVVKVYSVTNNTFTYLHKPVDTINGVSSSIEQFFWLQGYLAGTPIVKNNRKGTAHTDYYSYSIDTFLDHAYAAFNLPQIEYKTEISSTGIPFKKLYINDYEYGHEVTLLKECLFNQHAHRSHSSPIFSPVCYEFNDFSATEFHELIKEKSAIQVMKITRPFIHNNEIILDTNELFGAPYSRITISFTESSFLKNIAAIPLTCLQKLTHNYYTLIQEMRAAKEQTLKANREARIAKAHAVIAVQERNAIDRKSRIFEKYTNRSLVEKIERGIDPTTLQPTTNKMAVLFCSIKNFSQISENMSGSDTILFLNSFYKRMNAVIDTYNGEIDTHISNGIMSIFYSPEDAVNAAIEMRRSLQIYNRERISWGQDPITIGMGIEYGAVISGNIGSSQKMDFTYIGSTVALASKLENITEHYSVGIIVSENVKAALKQPYDIRFLDTLLPAGKKKVMQIYEVFDFEPDTIKAKKYGVQDELDRAFSLYESGSMKEAYEIYQKLHKEIGSHSFKSDKCADPAISFYMKRSKDIDFQFTTGMQNPKEWHGVYNC